MKGSKARRLKIWLQFEQNLLKIDQIIVDCFANSTSSDFLSSPLLKKKRSIKCSITFVHKTPSIHNFLIEFINLFYKRNNWILIEFFYAYFYIMKKNPLKSCMNSWVLMNGFSFNKKIWLLYYVFQLPSNVFFSLF